MRPAREADLPALLELAELLDSPNLPHDRAFLRRRLERSERAFRTPGPPHAEREYQFVLVDDASRVVGTSAILSKHGTPEMPHLPLGLLASTVSLAALSVFMHRAVRAARDNRNEGLLRELQLALAAALAFLACQALNWKSMVPALHGSDPYARYAFTFYWLTALHAAHVVGGFVPLGIVIVRARRLQYSSSRYEGVRLCKQYWDYLGVVWIVLLVTLYFAT